MPIVNCFFSQYFGLVIYIGPIPKQMPASREPVKARASVKTWLINVVELTHYCGQVAKALVLDSVLLLIPEHQQRGELRTN